jgi:curli biogenesis system outer membrane secretion channel CsgG
MTKSLAALCGVVCLATAPVFAAEKPSLGVAEFNNTATGVYWWGGGVGWELASMVSNELANTGKFQVVERAKLEPVLREQDLASSGRVAKPKAAKTGKLTGAQYLVMGTVSAFERNTQSTGGGLSFGGIAIGGKKDEAYLAIDLRVVDTTTGEVSYNRTVEGRSGGFGLNLGVFKGGFGGTLGHEQNTPAGKAIRAAIVEITDYLSCVMVDKGGCEAEYQAKEQKRRSGLKDSIKLD